MEAFIFSPVFFVMCLASMIVCVICAACSGRHYKKFLLIGGGCVFAFVLVGLMKLMGISWLKSSFLTIFMAVATLFVALAGIKLQNKLKSK